jgi:hypothetical protein
MLLSFVFSLLLAQMAAPAPTTVPNPPPDLSALSFLQGTWTCHSMLRGKDRPDTTTTTMTLNGRWLLAQDLAPPFDAYRKDPIHTQTYYSYDAQNKKYVSVSVDDFGGYGFATSPGWNGDTMVWTDKSSPDGSVAVSTIRKVSDSEYNVNITGTDGKGKPTPVVSSSCKKP